MAYTSTDPQGLLHVLHVCRRTRCGCRLYKQLIFLAMMTMMMPWWNWKENAIRRQTGSELGEMVKVGVVRGVCSVTIQTQAHRIPITWQ
jgi:hypothetical protein